MIGRPSLRLSATAAALVVSMTAVFVPAAAGTSAGAGRNVHAASSARSNDELAQRLVERFLDLLVDEPDIDGLRAFLSPAFIRQGADGTASTKSEYLGSTPAVISSYTIQDLEATRRGPVLVARYDVVTEETLGGRSGTTEPAPRLTVFVKDTAGWQVIAHSNFNAPISEPAG